MFLELIIAVIVGVILGAICGLIPGVHTNTVTAVMLSLSVFLLDYFQPVTLAATIAAMGVCQESLNCIPSTFLGVPDSDTALSVLPAHEMLIKGKGEDAVLINTAGSLLSLLTALTLVVPFIYLAKVIYPILKPYIGYLLLFASLVLIIKDKNKLWSIIIFILSGVLGVITLNLYSVKEPLLPLFSGLFGISMLALSMKNNTKIPKQEKGKLKIKLKNFKEIILSSVTGWICAFMPGLGPSQAAALTSQFAKFDREGFIFLIGGLSTANFVISFVTLYSIEKARNGAVVGISKLMQFLTLNDLIILLTVCLIAGGIAALLTPFISKKFSYLVSKVNYKLICTIVIIFIIGLVLIMSGLIGLIILLTATALGIVTNIKGIRKSAMMGCLLVPVMIFFLL
ncbi:MAG: tripartite tricarboxylate transporter permease [Nanoarchaeota archaeon]|nr:tripartite tricarboxylate transporter permease [Nanoarchaeota archaeon]MBU4352499.1 tripartite tricarboxylate transporter permease [Nanoarchaeota archaeon]MBU4456855.1 tripartite tricarboxylate transporter permease [Nanoarchaeota archaeon]MCG2719354.1 tripartite tricarboxylate transporter permease [Nanoarchaeota archaeon]